MKTGYKNTTYNINIAEHLEDDVRIAWEEGYPYKCTSVYLDETAVGFILLETGAVRKVAHLVYEFVEPDYRDRQIGTTIFEDTCNKMYELGYDAIYASIKGHTEDIGGKRYFLESQGFALAANTLIPTYFRKDIAESEWFLAFSNSEDLRRTFVDVDRELKDNLIVRELAKEGIIFSDNILCKAIVKNGELFGAILYGVDRNVLVVYEIHVFESDMPVKILCELLIAVFIELEQMKAEVNFVKICTNSSDAMDMLIRYLGQPYDMEIREEWLLRLTE